MQRLLPALLFCLALVLGTSAQSSVDSLLLELLNTPSPPSKARRQAESGDEERSRPISFYDQAKPPADDAPIDDIRDYWKVIESQVRYNDKPPKMTEAVAARLLENIARDPAALESYLTVLPVTGDVKHEVSSIFAKQRGSKNVTESWTDAVKKWLKFNTTDFIDELEADARTARDHKSYGSVINEDELQALARIDWDRAKPIIEQISSDSVNKRAAAMALAMLYEHAVSAKETSTAESLRDQLKNIVEDKNAPGRARNDAAEALFSTPWPGQDDWYISLFEDDSLRYSSDGSRLYSILESPAEKAPEKWIPQLIRLLESKNMAVRNSAVRCLMEIETKESLRPLIRWLSEPDWAELQWSPGGRTTLMQIVDKYDLPESIPGLIWIIDNEEENVHWAAPTLGTFKDPIAIPALRRALFDRSKEDNDRQALINALLDCGGLTVAEQIESLEVFAELSLNPLEYEKLKGRSAYEDENPPPVLVSIGKHLSELTVVSPELVTGLVQRQKELVREKPQVAKVLSELMSRWKGRLIDMALLSNVEDGTADSNTIIGLLARRKEVRENVPNSIYEMTGKPGLAGGIAACLKEDEGDTNSALGSDDTRKQISVMACSRLLRLPLPVDRIKTLLKSKDKLVSLAAERYLESVNTPETRQLLFARHPNEALILGPRISFNPANISTKFDYKSTLYKLFDSVGTAFSFSDSFSEMDEAETRLRNELRTDPELVRVYAHLPNYESGQRIVRIYKTHATYSYELDKARYQEKEIPKKELEPFLQKINEAEANNFVTTTVNCHHDCYSREFVSISKEGGQRVYNGSGFFAMGILDTFNNLFDQETLVTRYRSMRHVPELQVLYSGTDLTPTALWKEKGDFRILVEDNKRADAISAEISKLDDIDDKNKDLDYSERRTRARQRRIDREFENFRWIRFSGDKLTDIEVPEPAALPYLKRHASFPDADEFKDNTSMWKAIWNGYQIRIGVGGVDVELWRTNKDEQVKIIDGEFYGQPVVAGDWVVVATNDSNYERPKYLISINLRTGKQTKIDLPPTVEIEPIAYVEAHKRVLVSDGNEESESYYLVDPATGEKEKVTGEFTPLRTQYLRPMQPTNKADEFWATVTTTNSSEIGIYNAKTFTFNPLLVIPDIALRSDKVWVDAEESKAYFIYSDDFGRRSDILSVPLPKNVEPKR